MQVRLRLGGNSLEVIGVKIQVRRAAGAHEADLQLAPPSRVRGELYSAGAAKGCTVDALVGDADADTGVPHLNPGECIIVEAAVEERDIVGGRRASDKGLAQSPIPARGVGRVRADDNLAARAVTGRARVDAVDDIQPAARIRLKVGPREYVASLHV